MIFGLLAMFLGGEWIHFGDGIGGAWGIPTLVFDIVVLLSLPNLVIWIHRLIKRIPNRIQYLIGFGGPFIISTAFILIAHALDPCSSHHWTMMDFWGDQRLCERFGSDINIHTRFHLILHIAPIVALAAGYHWMLVQLHRKIHLDLTAAHNPPNPGDFPDPYTYDHKGSENKED